MTSCNARPKNDGYVGDNMLTNALCNCDSESQLPVATTGQAETDRPGIPGTVGRTCLDRSPEQPAARVNIVKYWETELIRRNNMLCASKNSLVTWRNTIARDRRVRFGEVWTNTLNGCL